MNDNSGFFYLALVNFKHISYRRYLEIIHTFGDIKNFFNSSDDEMLSFFKKIQLKVSEFDKNKWLDETRELEKNLIRDNIIFRAIDHELYPQKLKEIYQPPIGLFLKGNVDGFDRYMIKYEKKNIAIVGTRKALRYTCDMTKTIAMNLAENDFNIISGFAQGIDTYAHTGAIVAEGMTTAVFGSGINHLFPKTNIRLLRDFYDSGGVVISEYLPDETPKNYYFPQRNRIISGLSDGVLMMEASLKSGALITVRNAIDQNKDVFSFYSKDEKECFAGNRKIISEGAIAIHNSRDIIRHLYGDKIPVVDENINDELLYFLSKGPVALIELSKAIEKTPDETLIILAPYLLEGAVIETAGNKYYHNPSY